VGVKMNINTLKMLDNNPRKITDDAIECLAESIKRDPEFLRLRPIIVDENMTVIGGNQRVKAILKLGMVDIPDEWVRVAKDLTEEQRRRFILIDNSPRGMSGEWDLEILQCEYELEELELVGIEIKEIPLDIKKEKELPVKNIDYQEKFAVLVECENERHQQAVFDELCSKNFRCKVLVN
jgi:ParB-like chromosome segregation protein Spo0J